MSSGEITPFIESDEVIVTTDEFLSISGAYFGITAENPKAYGFVELYDEILRKEKARIRGVSLTSETAPVSKTALEYARSVVINDLQPADAASLERVGDLILEPSDDGWSELEYYDVLSLVKLYRRSVPRDGYSEDQEPSPRQLILWLESRLSNNVLKRSPIRIAVYHEDMLAESFESVFRQILSAE